MVDASNPTPITPEFPWLAVASDTAASLARRRHYRLMAAQLTAFLVVSVAGTLEGTLPHPYEPVMKTLVSFFLAIGLLIQGIIGIKGYEKIWFDCRAVAESAKTSVWRYMMNVTPFETAPDAFADEKVLTEMKEIGKARPGIEPYLIDANVDSPVLTPAMRAVRAGSLDDRRNLYFKYRLNDQRRWYEARTRESQAKASAWFWTVLMLQGGAFALSILQIGSVFPYYSILMTLAASFVAWSEARRYQETIQPYAIAAHELRDAETLWNAASNEAALQELIASVEAAISCEHTMWRAKHLV